MRKRTDELDLMLGQSRQASHTETYSTRRDAYEAMGAKVFREFEHEISTETRLTLERVCEQFEKDAGRPLADVDADAALVARSNRALGGYLILLVEELAR